MGNYEGMTAMMGSGGTWFWFPMALHGVLALAVLALIVVGTVLALRSVRAGPRAAVEILRTRYAQGEISREEFIERQKVLRI
ncbi:MAG: SHOCT domain-containing protein [Azospirillaceae bacterium]|nr:SHOCT domain-containing protein [Azospirillaceae bacterium]